MRRSEGNYMSLDPDTAMRGVRQDMSRDQLIEVAYNARCGAARRIALVYLGDQGFFESFAREDPDPMVRRGLVRRLESRAVVKQIAMTDGDSSVRETAEQTLLQMKILR